MEELPDQKLNLHKSQSQWSAEVSLLTNGESRALWAIGDNCNSEQMPGDPLLFLYNNFSSNKVFLAAS